MFPNVSGNINHERIGSVVFVKEIGSKYYTFKYPIATVLEFPNRLSTVSHYYGQHTIIVDFDSGRILDRHNLRWGEDTTTIFRDTRDINDSDLVLLDEDIDRETIRRVVVVWVHVRREHDFKDFLDEVCDNYIHTIVSIARHYRNPHNRPRPTTIQTEQPNFIRGLVHPYHSRRIDIAFKNTTHDLHRGRYFGIELEIDNDNLADRDIMANAINNILNNGQIGNFCRFEMDGSLTSGGGGFEIITQPMTYEYINLHRDLIKNALEQVDLNGYRSHDGGRCGMHIHLSRSEIDNTTLDNIYLIFENFRNELIIFSRRTQDALGWCRFVTDRMRGETTTLEGIINARRYDGNNHHTCINNGNTDTVEFRLFRGTTNFKTFMANIQLIDNIVNIARDKTMDELIGLRWTDIINYEATYTELKDYNVKRQIYSTHELTQGIDREEVLNRGVVLIRPFQRALEGDR